MRRKMAIWVQGAMRRIFPLDQPPQTSPAPLEISAARGETECLQIGVRVDGRYNGLLAEVSDLTGPDGAVIPAEASDILYPEYVPVKWATEAQQPRDVERQAPGFYPDALRPRWEFISNGAAPAPAQSVWVRIRVPHDARPGLYRGTVTVTIGDRHYQPGDPKKDFVNRQTARAGFRLRVWNFALPARGAMLVTNWFYAEDVARWHKQPLWSPAFWQLLEKYAADMADHRQNVILTPYFTGNQERRMLIGIARRGRRYHFDFTLFDRWCRTFFRHGFRMIEGAHIAGVSRDVPEIWLTAPNGGAVKASFNNAQDPRYEDFLAQFMRAFWGHLGRRGWRSRLVQHISDEPGPKQLRHYRRLAAIVRRAAPGIRVIDAIGHWEYAGLVDHPVPIESIYEEVMRRSGRRKEDVWVYYCCGPTRDWPNRFIDYLPIRWRILTWLCFQKGIPAFLHWGYNWWKGIRKETINPWDDLTGHCWSPGDPLMVYPPRDESMLADAPIGSIRWEIMRKGLEDYEYLRLTRELAEAGNAQAKALLELAARRVIRDWTTYTRDHALLEMVRCRMGRFLSEQRKPK
jgi:hypothetical protein